MMQADDLGFREEPFSELPDPRFTYRHRAFQAVCADLLYARMSERQGFTVVTGSEGSGKTALMQMLHEERATADRYHTFAAHRKLSPEKLLQQAIEAFGIVSHDQAVETDSEECFDFLKDYVLETSREGGRVIFLIDRAESLTGETLEGLTELAYLGEGDGRLLQLILAVRTAAGTRELPGGFREVMQDIAFQFHMGPLSPVEIEPYLRHRLAVAGYEGADLFDDAALDELAEISGGNPLRINRLARVALQLCQAEGTDRVGGASIVEAAEQCGYDGPPPHEPGPDDDDALVPESLPAESLPAEPLLAEPYQAGSRRELHVRPDDVAMSLDDDDVEFQWPASQPATPDPPRPAGPDRRAAPADLAADRPKDRSAGADAPDSDPGDDWPVPTDPDDWPLGEEPVEPGARPAPGTTPLDHPEPQTEEEILRLWEQARGPAASDQKPRLLARLRPGPTSVWRARLYAIAGMLLIGAIVFWIGGGDRDTARMDTTVADGALSDAGAQSGAVPAIAVPEPEPGRAPQQVGNTADTTAREADGAPSSEPTIVWESVDPAASGAEDGTQSTTTEPGIADGDPTSTALPAGPLDEQLVALDERLTQIMARLDALSHSQGAAPEVVQGRLPRGGPSDHRTAAEAAAGGSGPATGGDPKAAEIADLKNRIVSLAADLAALRGSGARASAGQTTGDPTTAAPQPANPSLAAPTEQEPSLAGRGTAPATTENQLPPDPDPQAEAAPQGQADSTEDLSAQLAVLLPKPAPEKPKNLVFDLQTKLAALGYKIGAPDGNLGGRTKRAIETYRRDHGLLSDGLWSLELYNHVTAFSLLKNAVLQYHEGKFDEAAASYGRVLEYQPGDRESRLLRALTNLRRGETGTALSDLKALSATASNHQDYAFYRPGRIYFIQERLKELGFNPGRQDGLMVRQSEDAIVAYERSHGLPSSGQPTIELLKHLEIQSQHSRAIDAFRSGDLLKALELYDLVVGLEPKDAEAYFNRGLTYKVLGRTDDALADYERAALIDPGLSKVYYDRGNIRWNQGRYKDALADYWWAVKSWW